MKKIINIENFSFCYDIQRVLDNINLSIYQGEMIGLLGENGSGKTTFLDCLYGFHGEFNNIDILSTKPSLSNKTIKENVSYIQDNPNLLDYVTAEQYLNFICNIENINKNDKQDEIMKLIKTFGLFDEYSSKLLKDYSFGMKKKIQFVSEFFLHKSLMIIDEPTNGLDIKMIILLKKLIKEEHKKNSTTFIISSHNTQFLQDVCARVLFFDNKKIKDIPLDINSNLENVFLKSKTRES